jgi:hypothetical protein
MFENVLRKSLVWRDERHGCSVLYIRGRVQQQTTCAWTYLSSLFTQSSGVQDQCLVHCFGWMLLLRISFMGCFIALCLTSRRYIPVSMMQATDLPCCRQLPGRGLFTAPIIEPVSTSETSVNLDETTCCSIAEDGCLHALRCKILKSHLVTICCHGSLLR